MNPEKPRSESIKPDTEQQAKIAKTEQKIPYETWASAIDYVNTLIKKLRKAHEEMGKVALDDGLENIFIALKGHGFESSSSCSGHLQDKKMTRVGDTTKDVPSLPYIYLRSTDDAAINQQTYTRLSRLLEEFYMNRPNVPIKDRIVLKIFDRNQFNKTGDWKRKSTSLEFSHTAWEKSPSDSSVEEINAKIAACQKEMNDFAEFLKSF